MLVGMMRHNCPFFISRGFLFSWGLFLFLCCNGQETVYHRFTTEDGLPGNHIHCVNVDSSGYIWAGTQGGAVRYDGYGFQVYDQDAGLPQNEILNIFEDSEGRVWLQGFNTLSYISDGQLTAVDLPISDSIPSSPRISILQGHAFLANQNFPRKKWTYQNGRWIEETSHLDLYPKETPNIFNTYQVNGVWWGHGREKLYQLAPANQPKSIPKFGKHISSPMPSKYWGAIMLANEELAIHNANSYTNFRLKDEFGDPLPPPLFCMEDSRGRFWVSTSSGLYSYDSRQLLNDPPPLEHGLQKDEITWMAEDLEHNMWFATARGGLIMRNANSFGFEILGPSQGLAGISVEDIAVNPDGKVFLGHDNGMVTVMGTHGSTDVLPIETQCRICRIRSILPKGNDSIMVLTDGLIHYIDLQTGKRLVLPNSGKCIRYQGGKYWFGNSRGLFALPDSLLNIAGQPESLDHLVFGYRTYASFWDRVRKEVWIGTNEGLKILHLPSGKLRSMEQVRSGVVDIQRDPLGRLWVTTDGQGVFIFQGYQSQNLSIRNGLSSNICHEIHFDNTGGAWIGTQKGINYLKLSHQPGYQVIRQLTHSDGLPSDEVLCVAQRGREILAGTSRGLVRIPLDYFEHFLPKQLSVSLTSMRIGRRDTLTGDYTNLAWNQNEIGLSYSALALQAKGSIDYRYRMIGLGNGEWRMTRERKIDFQSLPAGDYRFEVQARLADGDWGPTAATNLSIAPHFSETTWFLLTTIGLALALILLGAALRVRQVRNRVRRQGERDKMVVELELQALRTQMNPHFIFNALSAIQQFISSKDSLQAHRYLSTFSRLIRRVLENSQVEEISLAEERNTLELYLSLEKLRFGDQFEFELKITPTLDQERIILPPMLIQPFVENAIQHGLRHKSGPGKLLISFFKTGDDLCCIIEDNGVGRAAAAHMQPPSHGPSRGMEITQRRIRSFSELIRQKADISITDLFHEGGQPAGTKVKILVPLHTSQSHLQTQFHA